MMMSIQAMYTYDDTLFDGLDLPTYEDPETHEVTVIDKQTTINSILLNCAELEVLYPDPQTMKLAIGVWSAAEFNTWKKLLATTVIAYNPIWNVDAIETETFGKSTTNETAYDSQDKRTADLTDTRTPDLTTERTPDLTTERTPDLTTERTPDLTNERTPDLTTTKSVQGFNSSTWAEAEKEVLTGTDTNTETGTDTTTETGTDTVTETGTDTTTETGTDTTTHTGTDTVDYSGKDTVTSREDSGLTTRRTGNIGVTTTQKMLQEEREIAEFSIINYITQSFKKRFCLLIY